MGLESDSTAIVLNGTSSSGKSTIARVIQRQAGFPVVHVALDAFTDMFDWTSIKDAEVGAECHRAGVANLHAFLGIAAADKYLIVVDHVFEQRAWYEASRHALKDRRIVLVGVRCPLAVAESREAVRGNRRIGLAKHQFERVHEGMSYDLEVDTSLQTPAQCAQSILRLVSAS
jgi:chloramphenicol 3-O phosphotransferase